MPKSPKKSRTEPYYPTPREKDVILALHELGRATARKIARRAKLDKATCYKVLKKLEKKKLLTSEPIRDDGRYVAQWRLTDLGDKYANGLSHLFT